MEALEQAMRNLIRAGDRLRRLLDDLRHPRRKNGRWA